MDPASLIPTPDSIPAPSWIFLVLDLLLFTLHILVINIVVGGSLIIATSRIFGKEDQPGQTVHSVLANKLPTSFALGINLGVAPLLFMQVIYGHLFYTSSVLMAVYWILVIPLLIIAYYAAYIHVRKYTSSVMISKVAILITSLLLLYIGFIYVNNMTLMAQPGKWTAYFENRGGSILNMSDPTLIPRYLHFVVASVAVAGLFIAMVWSMRKKKGVEGADSKIHSALRIFGYATIVQVILGFWFLIAIPADFILQFMGRNIFYSLVLLVGFASGIGAIATAFMSKLRPTVIMLLTTIVAMVITRHNLRTLYLGDMFKLETLELSPQYDVLALFLVILIAGLAAVGYMVNQVRAADERRAG